LRAWNNYLITTVDGFDAGDIKMMIPEDVEVSVKFHEPMQVMTQDEKEKSVQMRLDMGLLSRAAALEELYNVTPEQAAEMIMEIDGTAPKTKLGTATIDEEPILDPIIENVAD
jgi:VIT1/CCC1 family predicted Fe2+/Mn2+ transporter